jgi:hypothetical protein
MDFIMEVGTGMYYLLIERVSTVTSEFLEYWTRVRIRLNQPSIERIVKQIGLFTFLFLTVGI